MTTVSQLTIEETTGNVKSMTTTYRHNLFAQPCASGDVVFIEAPV